MVEEIVVNDWMNLEEKEILEQELQEINAKSNYFKLDEGVSYKIKLVEPQYKKIVKANKDNEPFTKYVFKTIIAKGSDKSEWNGEFETGVTIAGFILRDINKCGFNPESIFNISKTGSGMDTKYSITKDF